MSKGLSFLESSITQRETGGEQAEFTSTALTDQDNSGWKYESNINIFSGDRIRVWIHYSVVDSYGYESFENSYYDFILTDTPQTSTVNTYLQNLELTINVPKASGNKIIITITCNDGQAFYAAMNNNRLNTSVVHYPSELLQYQYLFNGDVAVNGTFYCPNLFPQMTTITTPSFASDDIYTKKYNIGDPLSPMIVIKNLIFTGYIPGSGVPTASTKRTDIVVIAGVQKKIQAYSDQNQGAYTDIYLSYDDGILKITASSQYFTSIKSVSCDAISYIKLM